MHEVLVNRLGGLSLPRKSVVRLTDRPDMTLDVYHGRKTTIQQQQQQSHIFQREIIFVISCLLSWTMQPYQIGSTLKGKSLLPGEQTLFFKS